MKRTRKAMNAIDPGEWVALREDDGRAYLLQKTPGEIKIKGLGRFDSNQLLDGFAIGDRITVGQKSLTIVKPTLVEARRNMSRRAQVIGIKDSGFLIHSTPSPATAYAICPARTGKKSTGTRSIKFINNIQTKTVSASGAINVFLTEPNKD